MKLLKKIGEFIIEIIFPIIAAALIITALFLIGALVYLISDEVKMREQAEMIFHYDTDDYYIKSYEFSEDQIVAVGVNGKEIIFPKNCTVIEYINNDVKGVN